METIFLVDLDEAKSALSIVGDDEDDRVAIAIRDVTAEAAARLGIDGFDYTDEVEYPELSGPHVRRFRLSRRLPVHSIVALHVSTTFPRVYDSTTLLVEGTDFFLQDAARGRIELVEPVCFTGTTTQAVRVEYAGGYESVEDTPPALRSVALEVASTKWQKRRFNNYHVLNHQMQDGAVQGIRFDDWTPQQLEIVDRMKPGCVVGIG